MEKLRVKKAAEKQKEKEANKPEYPMSGQYSKGSRFHNGGTIAQYIMKNSAKNTMRDEDPREALLARASEAESNPLFVGLAYQHTQPKSIFNF